MADIAAEHTTDPAFSESESKKRLSSTLDTEAADTKRQAVDTTGTGAPTATTSTPNDAEGPDASAGAIQPSTEAPEEEIAVRALVESKYAGSLIGRQGATISYIRQQSGSRVNISDSNPGVDERICTVTGTTAGVFRAFSFICDKLRESMAADTTVDAAANVTIKVLVPNSQAGAIIGKQGAKIKEIRDATGAQVDLSKDLMPGSTERACSISGTAESVSQTVFHISCTMQQAGDRGTVTHFTPGQGGGAPFGAPGRPPQFGQPQPPHGFPQQGYPGYPQQGYGGYPQAGYPGYPQQGGGGGAPPAVYGGGGGGAAPAAPQNSHQLPVPNEFIGSIIGKKGSKINEIRTYSQAQIKIADNVPGSTDRIVTVSGTPEAVQLAHYLIQQRVDEARNAPGSQVP